jgi:FOG: GGDEF domain
LKEKNDTYILCFDIMGMDFINAVSYEAGDRAIIECLERINDAASEDMLLFRIGGDEFVLVTGLTEASKADELANKVISKNGNTVSSNGRDIPVSMRVGGARFNGGYLRYNELFEGLQKTIDNTRKKGKDILIQQ